MTQDQDFKVLQHALREIQPAPSHDASTPPSVEDIYAPAGHETALDPERPLIVGGRGVGKSFWASALIGESSRGLIATVYPRLALDRCDVALGFAGVDTAAGGAPSQEVLDELISKDRFEPEVIWRAVILRSLGDYAGQKLPVVWRGPSGLVSWANEDAERLQATLRTADRRLVESKRNLVIVFDALDRLGRNWSDIGTRTRALLRVALAMRSYKAIKPKIFMRVDQAEDQSLTNFPDASKLMGGKVDLVWERYDLYGLLFSLLSKGERCSEPFRRLVKRQTHISLDGITGEKLPVELMDESEQERVFTALAGPYMGSDRRRGKTYSWVYNHLSDAHGRVSPRTFLETMRVAAERSASLGSARVLDPKGLQAGLQAASRLRVDQLREEFRWIRSALEPLADLRVPCEDSALFDRWRSAKTTAAIRRSATTEGFLEPIEFEGGAGSEVQSLLEAMRRIGVAERRSDGRVNIPDIYRVAAKLLRHGGVRPTR